MVWVCDGAGYWCASDVCSGLVSGFRNSLEILKSAELSLASVGPQELDLVEASDQGALEVARLGQGIK